MGDILGTVFGILLSRTKLPTLPTFSFLSLGYLIASRKEVDSVELPYLNRARLAYSSSKYLQSGAVPAVPEANQNEPLLPWGRCARDWFDWIRLTPCMNKVIMILNPFF